MQDDRPCGTSFCRCDRLIQRIIPQHVEDRREGFGLDGGGLAGHFDQGGGDIGPACGTSAVTGCAAMDHAAFGFCRVQCRVHPVA